VKLDDSRRQNLGWQPPLDNSPYLVFARGKNVPAETMAAREHVLTGPKRTRSPPSVSLAAPLISSTSVSSGDRVVGLVLADRRMASANSLASSAGLRCRFCRRGVRRFAWPMSSAWVLDLPVESSLAS